MAFEAFKWAVAAASVVGVVLNIHRKRVCFAVWAVTNTSWVCVDVYHHVWAQAALQTIYVGLSFYGLYQWRAGK